MSLEALSKNILYYNLFPELSSKDLAIFCRVSKKYNRIIDDFVCDRIKFLKDKYPSTTIFDRQKWQAFFDVKTSPVFLNPRIIVPMLNKACPFSKKGEKVNQTHSLVFMPQGLTLTQMNELGEKPLKGFATKCFSLEGMESLCPELYQESISTPCWVLIKNENIEDSTNKPIDEQKNLVEAQEGYEVPTPLIKSIQFISKFVSTRTSLHSKESTICTTNSSDFPSVELSDFNGGLEKNCGCIIDILPSERADTNRGISAMRRLVC